jgi:hypothetical protein
MHLEEIGLAKNGSSTIFVKVEMSLQVLTRGRA